MMQPRSGAPSLIMKTIIRNEKALNYTVKYDEIIKNSTKYCLGNDAVIKLFKFLFFKKNK